ncbi:MAG: molybdenum cofactor biosynthesis protein MoaE [Pseudomonadota bacterium]
MDKCLTVRVQDSDFDIGTEIDALADSRTDIGAVVSFTGRCRDEDGTLAALELEHYPGMAEDEMMRIAEEAAERWPLNGITIIHRYGTIKPGEQIVLVISASKHRQAAFESASFIMDYLKSRAPFWKREIHKDGTPGAWVDAREADGNALERWR